MPPESSAEDQIAQPTGTQSGGAEQKTDVAAAQSSGADQKDVAAADTSAAGSQDEKKPASMLDAVKAAVERDRAEKASTSENGGPEQEVDPPNPDGKEAVDEGALGELTPDEFYRYGKRAQRRIRQLDGKTKELQKEVDRLAPAAENFERLSAFVHDAGLSRDEVDDLIKVGALAKTNPWAARERVVEFLKQLDQVTGHVLPDDLKQQVQQGYISEPHALELSQHRARQHRGDVQSQHQQQARQAEQARQTEQKLVNDVATAVSAWENKWKSEDPDYRALHARVSEKMELALVRAQQAGKLPKTTAEATALADKVLAEARQEMKPLLTKREPIRPVAGSHASPTARPKPTNMLEAIRQAVGR